MGQTPRKYWLSCHKGKILEDRFVCIAPKRNCISPFALCCSSSGSRYKDARARLPGYAVQMPGVNIYLLNPADTYCRRRWLSGHTPARNSDPVEWRAGKTESLPDRHPEPHAEHHPG